MPDKLYTKSSQFLHMQGKTKQPGALPPACLQARMPAYPTGFLSILVLALLQDIWSFLVAISESLRFNYHHSFSIVVVGATLCGAPWTPSLAHALFIYYLLFNIALYGGVYLLNGILDSPLDEKHPVKCHRPIPSGRISRTTGWAILASLWTTAFAGSYAYEGDTRYWLIFAAFVLINLAYSLHLRKTEWRFIVGMTMPLRLHLGWSIGHSVATASGVEVSQIPVVAFVVYAAGAFALQSLRFRIEATGESQGLARGAPLEVATTLLVTSFTALLMHPSELASRLAGFYGPLMGVCFFIPLIFPKQSWLFGTQQPFRATPHRRLHIFLALWELRDVWGLCKLTLLSANTAFNFLCMGWEDSLFGYWISVQVPIQKVVFILGHEGSSATKPLHKALMHDPECYGSTVFDTWFPSILCKVLFSPLKILFGWLNEPAEDHMFCMHYCRTQGMFTLFPSLLRHPDLAALMTEILSFREFDMQLLRRCMQRMRFMHGRGCDWYVARPLAMTRYTYLLAAAFPAAKVVVSYDACVQNVEAALTALVAQFAHVSGISMHDKLLQNYKQLYAKICSGEVSYTMGVLTDCDAPSGNMHVAEVAQWRREPHAVLAKLLSWFLNKTISPFEALQRLSPAVSALLENNGKLVVNEPADVVHAYASAGWQSVAKIVVDGSVKNV